MPINYKDYPPNWKTISFYIRSERAKWHCEFCGAQQGQPHPVTGSLVVLTVAHLGIAKPNGQPGDKRDLYDVRDENLAALCQRCHLNLDRGDILITQMHNRWRKEAQERIAAGQLPLWIER